MQGQSCADGGYLELASTGASEQLRADTRMYASTHAYLLDACAVQCINVRINLYVDCHIIDPLCLLCCFRSFAFLLKRAISFNPAPAAARLTPRSRLLRAGSGQQRTRRRGASVAKTGARHPATCKCASCCRRTRASLSNAVVLLCHWAAIDAAGQARALCQSGSRAPSAPKEGDIAPLCKRGGEVGHSCEHPQMQWVSHAGDCTRHHVGNTNVQVVGLVLQCSLRASQGATRLVHGN